MAPKKDRVANEKATSARERKAAVEAEKKMQKMKEVRMIKE